MTVAEPDTPPDSDRSVPRRRPRRRRLLVIGGLASLAVLIFVFIYFEPHTAFIDDEVSETIPGLDAVLAAEPSAPSETTPATIPTTVPATPASVPADAATPTASAATDAGPVATEPAPSTEAAPPATTSAAPGNSLSAGIATAQATGQPVVLSTGSFFSGEHSTNGTALVVALPDGSLVVRFEGLDTSNGPDLRVVLSPDEASESWQYSGRLILDELKGNVGDQNYVLGADVDLAGYRSVVIWCERFSVAFGAAAIDVVV